jgi:hypothetical protein
VGEVAGNWPRAKRFAETGAAGKSFSSLFGGIAGSITLLLVLLQPFYLEGAYLHLLSRTSLLRSSPNIKERD